MILPTQRVRIQKNLLQWYSLHRRDLPWRKTRNPYRIWISEIMLQQTQVATVIPYYKRFLKRFPTVSFLARANLSSILATWEGLGYYSRARNLRAAARIIMNQFGGKVPNQLQPLLSLPGIGRTTAGAIVSIAFNQESPVLDGNVTRVLSRIFAVSGDPSKKGTHHVLWSLSESLIPKGRSNAFNQALMDLGAMVCMPKHPLCSHCPLRRQCRANLLRAPEFYPQKIKRPRTPHREAVSVVIEKESNVYLHRRPPKGLLGGLWEFPNWPLPAGRKPRSWLERYLDTKDIAMRVGARIGTFHHTYSHFKLTLHVYRCETLPPGMQALRNRSVQAAKGVGKGAWVKSQRLASFPMSRLHRRIALFITGR